MSVGLETGFVIPALVLAEDREVSPTSGRDPGSLCCGDTVGSGRGDVPAQVRGRYVLKLPSLHLPLTTSPLGRTENQVTVSAVTSGPYFLLGHLSFLGLLSTAWKGL